MCNMTTLKLVLTLKDYLENKADIIREAYVADSGTQSMLEISL